MIHELAGCKLPPGHILVRADGQYVSEKVARTLYDDKAQLVWVFPYNDPGTVRTYHAAGMELRFKEVPQHIAAAIAPKDADAPK